LIYCDCHKDENDENESPQVPMQNVFNNKVNSGVNREEMNESEQGGDELSE